jgi:hypothetical protein
MTMTTMKMTTTSRGRSALARLLDGVWPVICTAVLLASSASASVALLPVDVAGVGADGPRVRAALVQELRAALGDDLVVVDEVGVPEGPGACTANAACLARVAVDGVDEVLLVRVDRGVLTADVWGHVTLRVHHVQSGRMLTFQAPISTTAADRDVRALVLRAYDPARLQGRLDVVGLADDDVLVVDGLRAAQPSLRLRAGRHDVTVWRGDGAGTTTTADVPLDGQVRVDAGPRSSGPVPSSSTRPTWLPWVHGGLAVASAGALVAVVMGNGGIPPVRDASAAAGISLTAVAAAATTAAIVEAWRGAGAQAAPVMAAAPSSKDGARR